MPFPPTVCTSFLPPSLLSAASSALLSDSILGATLQGHYWDPTKQMITEKERDADGNRLELCRGIRWIDNDVVNLISNIISVLLGASFSLVLL